MKITWSFPEIAQFHQLLLQAPGYVYDDEYPSELNFYLSVMNHKIMKLERYMAEIS